MDTLTTLLSQETSQRIGWVTALIFSVACADAASIPSASELIDKYTHALNSTSSFIEEYEKTMSGSSRSALGSSNTNASYHGEYRYDLDSQRMYFQEYGWGKLGPSEYDEDKPNYSLAVYGETNYSHGEVIGGKPGKARRYSRPEGQKATPPLGVSYLIGFMGNTEERLDNVLRNAKHVFVREQTEKMGGSECFVLEAETKCGQYKIWLDPERGYHPVQILHKASEGDFSFGHLMAKGDTAKASLKNVRFEQIDGVWVPMEADSRSDLRNAQGHFSTDNFHYKRTKLILNPDHDKLGSFDDPLKNPSNDQELKNGTRVQLDKDPKRYIWQDGRLIPEENKKEDTSKSRKR